MIKHLHRQFDSDRRIFKHAYEFVATGNGVWVVNNGVRTQVIDQDGNILSPVTTTNLTTSGTTTLGDSGENDATIINAGTTPVVIQSQDAGATGPLLRFYHNSASPAANDVVGGCVFRGKNDADEDVDYVTIGAGTEVVTDGSEEGSLAIQMMQGGTSNIAFLISPDVGGGRIDYVLGDILGSGLQDAQLSVGQSQAGNLKIKCGTLTLDPSSGITTATENTLVPVKFTAATEVIAAGNPGAISVACYATHISADAGGDAFTLANGTVIGQLKRIYFLATAGGTGVVTGSFRGANNTLTFTNAGEYAELIWDGTDWLDIELGSTNDTNIATPPVLSEV